MFGLGLLEMLLLGVIVLGLPVGAFYLLRRLVGAIERRGATRTELAALETRMLQLEEGMSAITEQLEQLAEGQRFTTRVLTERQSPTDAGSSPRDR